MAQNHEDAAADLHGEFAHRGDKETQIAAEKAAVATPSDTDSTPTPDGDEPTAHERSTLRRVGENLPASAYLIAVVELTERFTYYGAQGLFQNYISNRPNGADGPRGLGLGHQGATGLNTFFQFFCYLTPILGAIISDQYLGKYKTILLFAAVYWVGLLILWVTALPSMSHATGLGGYITAIIVIGLGTGGIKANIAPLIADQYQRRVMAVRTEATGERVIIDPAITYQRIYMVFYWCINVGALSLLATPFMERDKGFWSAYLLCFCMFNVGVTVLILQRKKYIIRPPQGQVITDSFKAIGMMIASRNTNAPKASWRNANGKNATVPWDDHFIDELKRALNACKVFLFYPIFWVCYGQFSSNFVSQAAQMEGHGMPNDLMQNFDPISILVFTPILDRIIYPILRRAGIELRPIMRITIGFWLAAFCLAYAAIVQHLIYRSGPCFDRPGGCPEGMNGEKTLPNHIHIVVQTPAYVFIGLSEIFISVTGLEYAYTKAPANMKSFVQSMYLLTNAIGSALNESLVPVLVDPKILWMYTGVACVAFVAGCATWVLFHHYDGLEEEMYDLDRDLPELNRDGVAIDKVGHKDELTPEKA